jgi:hypothetical protein
MTRAGLASKTVQEMVQEAWDKTGDDEARHFEGGQGEGEKFVVYDAKGNYHSAESYQESKEYGVGVFQDGEITMLYASKKDLLTHKEFLDRANWIYGEGGGHFAYHYAHTIQNGYEVNNNSEAKVYFYLMRERYKRAGDKSKKIQTIPPQEYFEGSWGTTNGGTQEKAREFNNLRGRKMNAMMKRVIAAVIESVTDSLADPTEGSDQWRGDEANKNAVYSNAAMFGTAGGRNHIFSRYGKSYTQKAKHVTDFSNK